MPQFLARYEFKYLIPPGRISELRALTRSFCVPDAFGDAGTYEVNSLYLDDVRWTTAKMTLDGVRDRFKARIRCYTWQPDDPVYCELKDRVGTTILKQRALVARSSIDGLLGGVLPESGTFTAEKESHQTDLETFRARMDHLDLRPRLWVRYQREAYGSPYGDGGRLTFDSSLEVQAPEHERPYEPDHDQWQSVPWDGPPVMVEMKFNGAFPRWMLQLVQGFELTRISGSKYVSGAVRSGHLPWAAMERSERWTAF
jgi:hypothetical protein